MGALLFTDRQQAKFEHIQYIQRELLKKKKSEKWNSILLFSIPAVVGYVAFSSLAAGFLFGLIFVVVRGVADDVLRQIYMLELKRSICEFDGDFNELNDKLKIDAKLMDVGA